MLALIRSQPAPSLELHTSLLQIRGKCFLSPGFQPPRSHMRSLNTRAPAPSRGAKEAFGVTWIHSYSGTFCEEWISFRQTSKPAATSAEDKTAFIAASRGKNKGPEIDANRLPTPSLYANPSCQQGSCI